jgi:copper(I)-binding protein
MIDGREARSEKRCSAAHVNARRRRSRRVRMFVTSLSTYDLRLTTARRLLPLILLAACNAASEPLAIVDAEIRVAPVGAVAASAYFVVHNNGAVADTLASVTSAAADSLSLHESMDHGDGVMMMMPLEWIEIPAGDSVAFTPGGRHVMLERFAPPLVIGDSARLTFRFRSGRVLEVTAPIRGVGDDG